ncbi:MAG TPA: type II secretion system protein [Candidatus Acidoferrales bacterium]|nr:type II secretion system protein [Candidatus Acidoferrales bacterium]
MKITNNVKNTRPVRGFSLVELMVVVAMITVVMAALLTQIDQAQQRATAEQGRVDDFQQARDFMAQVVREARQMGYPNVNNFDTSNSTTWPLPLINDSGLAVGLVKLTNTELDFEGDIDGSGVSLVSYKLNGDGLCAKCMERFQEPKPNAANPLTSVGSIAAGSYVQEVQNVLTTNAIFSAYDAAGGVINLPVDITSDAPHTAQVRLIKINLSVANPTSVDPRTGHQLEADLSGDVQIVNCSMAATTATVANVAGMQMTCQ